MAGGEWAPSGVDITRASIARVYDYMLGGKDNFAVDRMASEAVLKVTPDAATVGQANRAFMRRAVRFLAGEAGIDQFLDLGSGLPTQGNVHQVAQEMNPAARVVYVDNDPMALVHGRALLADSGRTVVVGADLREPDELLANPEIQKNIDFSRPVGLLMVAILHHIRDKEDPDGLARRYREALPSGSYLTISHFHNPGDKHPDVSRKAIAIEKIFNETLGTGRWRTYDEIRAYFGDWDLLEPGLVPVAAWRATPEGAFGKADMHACIGGVARKP